MLLSVNMLKRHSVTLDPDVAPRAFSWTLYKAGEEPRNISSVVWQVRPSEVFPRSELGVAPRYNLTRSARPGEFVNTFGIGAALSAVPVYAVLDLFTDIEADQFWWWHGAALCASLLTACTALLIFLIARSYVAARPAFLIALAFGLGSCAWPMSSQALWQHPANSFFLALGAWFLFRISRAGELARGATATAAVADNQEIDDVAAGSENGSGGTQKNQPHAAALADKQEIDDVAAGGGDGGENGSGDGSEGEQKDQPPAAALAPAGAAPARAALCNAVGCGAALGMAVLCRPTSAVVVACVAAYLLWRERRCLVAYVLGGLPFALLLAAYNGYYLGSPFAFGQIIASKLILDPVSAAESLWQSSWRESLPGLLFSPSRGLACFSPVLLFGLAGAALAWKTPHYRPLLPLLASCVILLLIAGRWADWGGGASYGYRSIVDTTPFLALLLLPVIERVLALRAWRILFGVAFVWSVWVQFVGAYAYSVRGYGDFLHNKGEPVSMWSVTNSPIIWHMRNFRSQREQKQREEAWFTNVQTQILYLQP